MLLLETPKLFLGI